MQQKQFRMKAFQTHTAAQLNSGIQPLQTQQKPCVTEAWQTKLLKQHSLFTDMFVCPWGGGYVSSDDYQVSLAGGGYGQGWVCSKWGWVSQVPWYTHPPTSHTPGGSHQHPIGILSCFYFHFEYCLYVVVYHPLKTNI